MNGLRIAVAAGGTGGHILPALALFKALKQASGVEAVRFVCRAEDVRLIRKLEEIGSETVFVRGAGMPRSFGPELLRFAAGLAASLKDSAGFVRSFRPDILVTFGGYIGFMPALAARLAGTRLVLIEQNSVPGLANRLMYPFSSLTVLNFRYAKRWFRRAEVLGNPVDPAIGSADREQALAFFGLDSAKPVVLVVGGSQGARGLNEILLKGLPDLADCGILWATGRKNFDEIRSRLAPGTEHVVVKDFIERMDLAWAAADMAVCRSGAATVSEMRKAGVASLLVPYPHATDDHQFHNAREQEEAGLAMVIREEDLTPGKLVESVRKILKDRAAYKARFSAIDEAGVTGRIVAAILGLGRRR